MKRQKKWRMLGMAFVGIFAMAGCSSSASEPMEEIRTAEEYVQMAKNALAEADSFAADFEAVASMEGSGETVTTGHTIFVKEPLFMKVDTNMAFESTQQQYTIYLEGEGKDAANQYMDFEGQWTEMTMTKENAMLGVKIYHTAENMQIFLNAAEGWEISATGENPTLCALIPANKLFHVEESGKLFQLAGMSGLSEVYFTDLKDVPLKIVVDGKTGTPLSYEIDLADALETVTNNVLKELGGETQENAVTVEAYTLSSTLTQLGSVVAEEIPQAAKNAINYEKEISLLENNAG